MHHVIMKKKKRHMIRTNDNFRVMMRLIEPYESIKTILSLCSAETKEL